MKQSRDTDGTIDVTEKDIDDMLDAIGENIGEIMTSGMPEEWKNRYAEQCIALAESMKHFTMTKEEFNRRLAALHPAAGTKADVQKKCTEYIGLTVALLGKKYRDAGLYGQVTVVDVNSRSVVTDRGFNAPRGPRLGEIYGIMRLRHRTFLEDISAGRLAVMQRPVTHENLKDFAKALIYLAKWFASGGWPGILEELKRSGVKRFTERFPNLAAGEHRKDMEEIDRLVDNINAFAALDEFTREAKLTFIEHYDRLAFLTDQSSWHERRVAVEKLQKI